MHEKELLDFIIRLNLIKSKDVNLRTKIESDLGITGEDAIDFINDFSRKFQVNYDTFNYNKHFRDESGNYNGFQGNKVTKDEINELLVQDLLDAITRTELV